MRKRQKSRRKRGNGNRQIDQRDREWLTRGERFEEKNARQTCTKRRQEQLDSTVKVIDVSLNEYADNPQAPASGRISKAKGVTVVLHKEAKMDNTISKVEEDVVDDWFLNEDSDLEYQESGDGDDVQDETGLVEDSSQVKEKGVEDNVQVYVQYPPDIWYLISSYISPLQVGCFAAICRDAYNVTTTAAFWKSLYQRFYSRDAKLPVELQPFSMSRTYGIRALVIRALHIMFEPYVKRIQSLPSIAEGMDAPSSLASRTCLYMWSRGQVGCHYYHFFKFQADDTPEITNYFNQDVYFNPHKNECILKVFCQNFQHFPTEKVMGSRLVNVSISVSGNFRYHRLKLQFTKGQLRGRPRDSDLLSVVLDPVIVIRVLHWWHPQFQECLNQGSTFGTAHTVAAASAVWEGRI